MMKIKNFVNIEDFVMDKNDYHARFDKKNRSIDYGI